MQSALRNPEYVPQAGSRPEVLTEVEKRRRAERDTKVGKAIFYSTVAVALWFFYWLAGINCPC